MLKLKIIYENRDYTITRINLSLTEARNYFIGNYFNIGNATDNIQKCIGIEAI